MKVFMLVFALASYIILDSTSAEQVRNNKQDTTNKEELFKRRPYTPVDSVGRIMRSNDAIPAYHGNKWPRYKLTRNKGTRTNQIWKVSKENSNKKWKRGNNTWKNSQEKASSVGEKIEGLSVVEKPSDINVAYPKRDVISRVDNPNNVSHHDKTKRIWEIEKKARSNYSNLKKMDVDGNDGDGNDGNGNGKKQLVGGNKNNNGKRISSKVMEIERRDPKKERLRKKLEDEALQKLRDLDKKILELQAADLLEKKKRSTASTSDGTTKHSSNFYVAWIHAMANYAKNFLNSS